MFDYLYVIIKNKSYIWIHSKYIKTETQLDPPKCNKYFRKNLN